MKTEADGAIVGKPPMNSVHISKRALRNKSLAVTFNEKDLRDYVGGFHKRKKKRRKEALKQQGEAERRKRLEDRKKRRKEKEYVLYGGAPPEDGAKPVDEDQEQNDEIELNPLASVEGTTSYENGDIMVTVTTSEIGLEESPTEKSAPLLPLPGSTGEAVKKQNIPVSKKKAFKKSTKGRSRTKLVSKRERRKGKINGKKRR
ncbi:ankyrin repeat and KH domain-containing protein 1-like [Chenopodium quinoa]|uniref:Ribosomal RNA-processing protein 17 n=1 Tax=Chenopodium quinoa TaxID=63459 RepID=A0A803LL78_CHEQI|nr:ankyrin repeat and KH domain-containing protein 1-like [Chenopodium quinoa]